MAHYFHKLKRPLHFIFYFVLQRNTGRHNGRNERRACSRHPEHFAPPACWIISVSFHDDTMFLCKDSTPIDTCLKISYILHTQRPPFPCGQNVFSNSCRVFSLFFFWRIWLNLTLERPCPHPRDRCQ